MKDEIKEILDNLEDAGFCYKRIAPEEIKKILDYITNLQQDYNKAMELIDKGVENSYKMLKELQQENERLKENNLTMQEEMARTWEKCDDYKSRCEKLEMELEKCKKNGK